MSATIRSHPARKSNKKGRAGTTLHAFLEVTDRVSDIASDGTGGIRAISAYEAFRNYDWLRNIPVPNEAGDLRGMVLNSRWAAVFHFSNDSLNLLGNISTIASLGVNIAQASGEIRDILESNASWNLKGARLSDQVASICLRTAGGGVLGGVDLAAHLTSAALGLAGRAGLKPAPQLARKITSLDRSLDTWFNTVTDGNNIYLVVQKYFAGRLSFL